MLSTSALLASTTTPEQQLAPALVVWPVDTADVQKTLRFANKHNLFVSIAGTCYDFLNWHTCNDGVFIRTSLLKDTEFDLNYARGGKIGGTVRLCTGVVFSEAHKYASDRGRFLSSGWAITVGVVGWSKGGGHGPFAPSAGIGVDSIVEAELVTADGSVVRASAKEDADLFWALRGRGGSLDHQTKGTHATHTHRHCRLCPSRRTRGVWRRC